MSYMFGAGHRPVFISLGILLALVTLAWYDFDHYRIPNWINYPLILAGLVYSYVVVRPDLYMHVLGAVAGYGFIWALNFYWRARHQKDGIGMGDAKLFAAAGAWFGLLALPFVSLISSAGALLFVMTAKLFQRAQGANDPRIAFGPFIALGFWFVWMVPLERFY